MDMTQDNEKTNYKEKQVQSHKNKAESTQEEYLRIGNGFLEREMDKKGISRTAGNICKALKQWSETVRPNTYRKMQCALEYQQYSNKFYKAAEQIRNTQRIGHGDLKSKKQRKRRCKSINEQDHMKLLMASLKKGDKQLSSALTVVYHLGLRPAELTLLEYEDEGDTLTIYVMGAKKDVKGFRSIDKEVSLSLDVGQKKTLMNAIDSLYGLTEKQVGAMKSRMSRLTRKVFPKRQYRPGLYAYRYQLGSDLKKAVSGSSGSGSQNSSSNERILTHKEVSAIMGHRSQNSLTQYGHSNSSGGLNRQLPTVSQESVNQVNDDFKQTKFMQ